MKHKDTSTSC